MLLAGMGLACLIAVFEFIWKSRKMAIASAGDDTVRFLYFLAVMYSVLVKLNFFGCSIQISGLRWPRR